MPRNLRNLMSVQTGRVSSHLERAREEVEPHRWIYSMTFYLCSAGSRVSLGSPGHGSIAVDACVRIAVVALRG